MIKLNVGGRVFATLKSTLTRNNTGDSESYFDGLLGGKFVTTVDTDGSFFIDRNPEHFQMVLDYLRMGRLPEKATTAMLDEAQFYSLPDLVRQLQAMLDSQEKKVVVAADAALFERFEGCYVPVTGKRAIGALAFEGDKVVVTLEGWENLCAFCLTDTVPSIWGNDRAVATDYAAFVATLIKRGKMSRSGQHVLIHLDIHASKIPVVIVDSKNILLLTGKEFVCYSFRPWRQE